MRIAKIACHHGVDSLLKIALGDRLTIIFRPEYQEDPKWTWLMDREPPLRDKEYDILIVDDMPTFQYLVDYGIKSPSQVWYVHGTYTTWKNFQLFANSNFKDMHAIFTDRSRRGSVLSWYNHDFRSELIQPICPPESWFQHCSMERNGRIAVIGNDLMSKCFLYEYPERAINILWTLGASGKLDLMGMNGYTLSALTYDGIRILPGIYNLGFKPCIRESVGNYNAYLHVSGVPTIGFTLMEAMASGLPAITTPKVGLPEELSGKAYYLYEREDEAVRYALELADDKEKSRSMGIAGQKFLRENFSFETYRENLIRFFEGVLKC